MGFPKLEDRKEIDYYALFLGPKAENADILRALLNWAVDRNIEWRQHFAENKKDNESISYDIKTLKSFKDTRSHLVEVLDKLYQRLKKSTEIFSPRYIPHMVADPSIPAIAGYFAGVLCNQNNIVREVSESTFELEREVVFELGQLVGYVQTEEDKRKIGGYLTSGGTTANFQALWVARNKAYFPFAIRDIVEIYDQLGYHLSVNVRVGETEFDIRELSDEALLNIPPTKVNDLYRDLLRATIEAKIHEDEIRRAEWQRNLIKNVGIRAHGLWKENPGIVLTSVVSHYSVWKICDAMGIGIDQCKIVDADENYRMKSSDLKNRLEEAKEKGWKVIAVVATMGTTETGSIDPLDEIVEIKQDYDFLIHADAAWGGYACCVPEVVLGSTVKRKLNFMKEADSVVIDPHKLGYIPYQCGAVLFKDKIDLEYTASIAPYLFHPGAPPEIEFYGQYTLEGSRAGAMAASCWAAHQTIGLNELGYGKIIGDTIKRAKKLSTKLRNLERPYADFVEVMNNPELNIVCFRLKFKRMKMQDQNRLTREVYRRINQDRNFLVSCTDELKRSESDKEGPLAIRICIVNPLTNELIINNFVEEVKAHIDKIRDELYRKRIS